MNGCLRTRTGAVASFWRLSGSLLCCCIGLASVQLHKRTCIGTKATEYMCHCVSLHCNEWQMRDETPM